MSKSLRAAIEGADAAIYAYGVIGAHTREPGRARKALAAYREVRTILQARVAEPVAAASAYALPFAVTDGASAARLAAFVDNRMTALLADAAAASTGEFREVAVSAAMECAARAVAWGGEPLAFPHA